MKTFKKCLCWLLIAQSTFLCGCSQSSQLENLSYVVVMGLDQSSDGQLEMTVQIPRISGGAKDSGSEASGGEYIHITVQAADFESALERLDWASPRKMNLAHLKLIAVSEKFAQSDLFRRCIENIAQTERLYTATKLVVCKDSAREFVSAIKPTLGTRISADINAIFEHYTDSGYIPNSSVADLYYQTESIYSNPMVAYALLDTQASQQKQSPEAKTASALSENAEKISSLTESDIPTRYLGAAVFAEGRMVGLLNGKECILANLIRNEVSTMRYACDGQSLTIVPARPTHIRIDTNSDSPRIKINMKLAIAAQEKLPDEERLRSALKTDIINTLHTAQHMNAEPFGFAQKAAKNFLTLDDWLHYDWKKRFKNAQFEIELSFARSDT